MQYLHSSIFASADDVVRVDLEGNAANVELVDDANFAAYRRGGSHRYYGGHFTRSPALIPVPHTGHWHVVIDLGGGRGHVRANVSVIPAP